MTFAFYERVVVRRRGWRPPGAGFSTGCACLAIALWAGAGAAEEMERLDAIPPQLMAETDEHGATWSIAGAGHLVDPESKLFNHVHYLNVNGVDFKPEKGAKSKDGPHWLLTQKIENIIVGRDIVYDGDRGGVRYLDMFRNTGKDEVEVKVEYRSSYRYPWHQIYDAQGRIFEGKLDARGTGIFVKMGEDQEHQGVLFLVAGERSGRKPGIEIRDKEIRMQAALTVPGESSLSIVQWVARRRLVEPSEIRDLTGEFYRQRVLAKADIPAEIRPSVVNFDLAQEEGGEVQPHNESLLVAVGDLAERVGALRTGQDVLWVTKGSQLSGRVEGGGIVGTSRFGPFEVSLGEVAALRGGGGRGREPRVYLRDGSVLQGDFAIDGLKLTGDDGWSLELDISQVEYLFLRVAESDGRIEDGCNLFLELHSGDVCGIAGSGEEQLDFVTPWGGFAVPLTEVRSMAYLKTPSPRYRLRLADGSRITAFLVDAAVALRAQRFGEIELETSEISGAWSALGGVPRATGEIAEIGDLKESDFPACLLKGENLIAGRLGDEEIHVVTGTTMTSLKTAEIASITRSYDEGSEQVPVFEIELKGGDLLLGTLRKDTLRVVGEHIDWEVPVSHFLGMTIPFPVEP